MQRNILITGAANGLGKALTELFSGKGDIVFATDINPEVKKMYLKKENIFTFMMDVSNVESIQKTYQEIKKKTGIIDVLINNAGIAGFYPLLEASEEEIQKIYQVNTFGPYRVTKIFFSLLIGPKSKVINISSESVKLPTLFQPYPASKIAMEVLMRSVGQELFLKEVQTTFIRPGAIKTALLEHLHILERAPKESLFKKEYDQFIEKAPKREGNPVEPSVAASKIYKISQKKRLKYVYRINNDPLLRFASVLPAGMVNRMMKRMVQ